MPQSQSLGILAKSRFLLRVPFELKRGLLGQVHRPLIHWNCCFCWRVFPSLRIWWWWLKYSRRLILTCEAWKECGNGWSDWFVCVERRFWYAILSGRWSWPFLFLYTVTSILYLRVPGKSCIRSGSVFMQCPSMAVLLVAGTIVNLYRYKCFFHNRKRKKQSVCSKFSHCVACATIICIDYYYIFSL